MKHYKMQTSILVRIGDQYEIESKCYEDTYPCQHWVKNLQDGTTKMMLGTDIYNLLQTSGQIDSHFSQYLPRPYNSNARTN